MMIRQIRYYAIALSLFLSSQTLSQDVEKPWYIPDFYKAQFAGNIGFISVGAGYVHGNEKLETDLLTGFVPKFIGGDRIVTVTLKSTYKPWQRQLNEKYTLVPFTAGLYLSYSFGSQFDTISPNEYPEGYYWWASSLRVGGFIGGMLVLNKNDTSRIKNLTLFYELGSYDLLFLSYIQNTDYLKIWDVTNLALGVKVGL